MYIKSTSTKQYQFNGVLIPSATDKGWANIGTTEYKAIEANKVFKSLVQSGSITVQEKEPDELRLSPARAAATAQQLQNDLTTAQKANKELEEKYAALEAEAKETIVALRKELAELKAASEGKK